MRLGLVVENLNQLVENLNQLEPDSMTRAMDDICTTFNLSQLIDVPTRITDNTSTLIDLIYALNLSFITKSGVLHLGISDHFGIFATRSTRNAKKSQQDHLNIEYRDLKASNEAKFLEDVESSPWQLVDLFDEIDEKVDTFYHLIIQLMNWHAPTRSRRIKKESYPGINSTVIELVRQKTYAYQLYLRNK